MMPTQVIAQNVALLRQLEDLLHTLTDAQYANPLPALGDQSIGQHVRHIVDFYMAVIRRKATQVVDYDARMREEAIASFRYRAQERIAALAQELATQEVSAPVSVTSNGCAALASSVGRELSFAHDHAVHHLAIIKVGLRVHAPSVDLPAHLGVAPSTLQQQGQ